MRVVIDGDLEIVDGFGQAFLGPLVPVIASFEVVVVTLSADGASGSEPYLVLWRQFDSDFIHDGAGDVALQREDIAQLALVIFPPELPICTHFHDLPTHSPPAPPPHP